MKLARIPYANTAPFFHFLSSRWLKQHTLHSANPRQLGELARRGELDAGLFSQVDAWDLVEHGGFELLGDLGIAGRGPIQSVMLFGSKNPKSLEGKPIGVTAHTATSSRLMEAWLKEKVGIKSYSPVGPKEKHAALLLIGDEALQRLHSPLPGEPKPIDLCGEWKAWTGLPFVFARWAVRKSLPDREKGELLLSLKSALELALDDLEHVAERVAQDTVFEAEFVEKYLSGITYKMGPEEEQGSHLFREKLKAYNNGL